MFVLVWPRMMVIIICLILVATWARLLSTSTLLKLSVQLQATFSYCHSAGANSLWCCCFVGLVHTLPLHWPSCVVRLWRWWNEANWHAQATRYVSTYLLSFIVIVISFVSTLIQLCSLYTLNFAIQYLQRDRSLCWRNWRHWIQSYVTVIRSQRIYRVSD